MATSIRTPFDASLDELECQILVMGVLEGIHPPRGVLGWMDWRMNGLFSRTLRETFFDGTFGDCLLMPSQRRLPSPKVLLVGLGSEAKYDSDRLSRILVIVKDKVHGIQSKEVALYFPKFKDVPEEKFLLHVQKMWDRLYMSDEPDPSLSEVHCRLVSENVNISMS